jgi:predicted  nucleic acid-binding Zn-ribbon protein
MKRPHRSIEVFDISLMAVVTKAMGAFLVLMLLLMPYYSSSPIGTKEAQELTRKVQDADAKIKSVLNQLGGQSPLSQDLKTARQSLGSGTDLIKRLKRSIDELSAQVARLGDQVKDKTNALDQATTQLAALKTQMAQLKKDFDKAKSSLSKLQTQVAQLQAENKTLKDKNDALQKQVAELGNANQMKAELDKLQSQVKQLQDQVQQLKDQNQKLASQLLQVTAERDSLKQQLAQAKAKKGSNLSAAEVKKLQDENAKLKDEVNGAMISVQLYDVNCPSVGALQVLLTAPDILYTEADNTQSKYGLDLWNNGLGEGGENSQVYRGAVADIYVIAVVGRASTKPTSRRHGSDVVALQAPSGSCTASVGGVVDVRNDTHLVLPLTQVTLRYYAQAVWDIVVDADDKLRMHQASPASVDFINSQIAHAEKAPRSGVQGATTEKTVMPPTTSVSGTNTQRRRPQSR